MQAEESSFGMSLLCDASSPRLMPTWQSSQKKVKQARMIWSLLGIEQIKMGRLMIPKFMVVHSLFLTDTRSFKDSLTVMMTVA